MSKNKSHYSEEFKADAVKLILEERYKPSEASRNLGVSQKTLRDWVKKKQTSLMKPGAEESQQKELKRLQEENRRLKMEREILKKAAAFFARENL